MNIPCDYANLPIIMALDFRGGHRIIKAMGIDMVKLEKYCGLCCRGRRFRQHAGFNGTGIPTTNAKATAMMGAGASKGVGLAIGNR